MFKGGSEDVCDVKSRISILFNYHNDIENLNDGELFPVVIDDDDISLESDSTEIMHNIETQTSRKSIPSKHSVGIATVQSTANSTSKQSVCIQIEEALHLPKYLAGEEYTEPEVYVSYQIPGAKVISTDAIKSIKPKWNFRENMTMDIQVIKEKRNEFKVWRCVENGMRSSKDLLIGVAEVDTSPLFYGKLKFLFSEVQYY